MKLQVGVKVLLKNNEGAFLLLRRAEAFHNEVEPHWDIPGGRIDPNETLDVALRREIKEETGLTIDDEFTLIAAQDIIVPAKDLHVVRLTYTATGEGLVVVSDEHQETKWTSIKEALSLNIDPYLKDVLNEKASVL
jgi:8-oxo-dGTP diphosphatase